MLIRSINGETPEGAVPVEYRGLNTEADIKSAYNNVPDGHSEAIQYEVLYKYRTAVRYFLIENYLTAVFLGIYVPACTVYHYFKRAMRLRKNKLITSKPMLQPSKMIPL